MARRIGSLADRLLGLLVPRGHADAASCYYEQCGARHSRYCCYYPDDNVIICGSCVYRP
ncbi:hypothetical protein [Sphaerisporangium perillae]|uniref:hypothetical protein n=1 Tax=Sphaerisporangium perillae TaxID=2935860 RepID=UPI00200BFD09|nr:hypothetical protein [Sphaerisporangium perillae]